MIKNDSANIFFHIFVVNYENSLLESEYFKFQED
jgi:hypothetical protein